LSSSFTASAPQPHFLERTKPLTAGERIACTARAPAALAGVHALADMVFEDYVWGLSGQA
jgi:hypothetical protein